MTADLGRFRERLHVTSDKGFSLEARCPAHDDEHASLSVSLGDDGGTVLHCHAGCDVRAVVAALGLGMADLEGAPRLVARYAYQDAAGETLWVQERWAPKAFRANPGLPVAATRVLYNLPWVLWAVATGATVYIVEGEKDVESLRAAGLVGTCNVNGAGKWLAHYAQWLVGATVVVIADNDKPGLEHARHVAASLIAVARSVTLERPLFGKDVSDLLSAGYGIDHTEPVAQVESGIVMANMIRGREVEWAWHGYIPLGALTMIDGDPGDGKSTLACKLVASWSNGLPLPGESSGAQRRGSIMISAEDDAARTIVPRLKAAGADLSQVHLITDELGDDATFVLSTERLAMLGSYLQDHPEIGAIIIDPLSAFWPAAVNSYVDAEVRAALRPLNRLARAYGIAVVLVRHLSKSATRAMYAGGGSIGIVGAARAAFLVKADPMNPHSRLFVPIKNNLGPRPAALAFHLEPNEYGMAAVHFDGEATVNADDLVSGNAAAQVERKTAKISAGSWLWEALDNTWLTWREVLAMGKSAGGWSEATLRRARDEGEYRSVKNPAIGGLISLGTYWIRADQYPFETTDGDQLSQLAQDSTSQNVSKLTKLDTESDIAPLEPVDLETGEPPEFDALSRAQPRVCDVCGATSDDATVVGYAAPWWAIRCRAHDPRAYRP